MKYVLLAFGILLGLGGLFALAAGYATIFDGNMGSLIAGTVAFSAGVLVLGQVFLLRALDRLHAAIEQRGAEPGIAAENETAFDAAPRPSAYAGPSDFAKAAIPPVPAFPEQPQASGPDFGLAQMLRTPAAPAAWAPEAAFAPPEPALEEEDPVLANELEAALAPPNAFLRDRSVRRAPPHAKANAEPDIAQVDADLLFKAATTAPPPRPSPAPDPFRPRFEDAAPAGRSSPPTSPRAASLMPEPAPSLAPAPISPSLTEMWRRITPRAENSAAFLNKAGEEPAAAPMISEQDHAVENLAGAFERDESDRAADSDADAHTPATREAELGHWFDRALNGFEDSAPAQNEKAVSEPRNDWSNPPIMPEDKESLLPDAPEPTAETDELTEVSRFQVVDTTYVMFSDGSIEARSEQGVYRFSSMADLKSFFDSQTAAE